MIENIKIERMPHQVFLPFYLVANAMGIKMDNQKRFRYPDFLVKTYDDFKAMSTIINRGTYLSLDFVVPMLRNRGTSLIKNSDNSLSIMGWQRDITRMRKQDVSLSFILYLKVKESGIIEEITIDSSFNGGKGILCSRTYLEEILQKEFLGIEFDGRLSAKLRLNRLKCFHIHEIFNSIYTTYFLYKEGFAGDEKGFYEEDTIDSYGTEGNLILSGCQKYKGRPPISYATCFYDMFNHVTFDREGYMNLKGNIDVEFYIEEEQILKDSLYQGENDAIFLKFQKFIYACTGKLQNRLVPGYKHKIMNTNLYSSAFIGAVMQAVGIRVFKDNFNYIQFIMTAMQRPGKKPGCIGAILSEEEAKEHFEGFDLHEISS